LFDLLCVSRPATKAIELKLTRLPFAFGLWTSDIGPALTRPALKNAYGQKGAGCAPKSLMPKLGSADSIIDV